MPSKSDFSDYAPVIRPTNPEALALEGAEEGSLDPGPLRRNLKNDTPAVGRFVPPRQRFPSNQLAGPHQQTVTKKTAAESVESLDRSPFLQRGHTLSFAGLYLFTAVLYFRPYELFPSLQWLSTSAFWIAVFTAIVFFPTQLGLENRITARPREVKLLLFLVLAAVLSIPLALDRIRAWDSFTQYLNVVFMFIVIVNVVRTRKRLKALLLLCLVASFVLSVVAVNDYRLGRLALQGQRIAGLIGGMFENPNDLALHLVTMMPLAVALFLTTRNPLGKVAYAVTAVVIIGGTVATFSRGGFLGLV